jgi:radical SAM superfamily enzyme YgiQ (UPF0313 family)
VHILLFSDSNGSYGFGRYAGVYRLATELRMAGYKTQVVEFFSDLSQGEVSGVLEKFVGADTLIVGISTTLLGSSMTYDEKKDFFETYSREKNRNFFHKNGYFPKSPKWMGDFFGEIKTLNPKIKIVVGGGKVESYRRELEYPLVDYWFWGESDKSLIQLANSISSGNIESFRSHHIRGANHVYSKRDFKFDEFSSSKILWSEEDAIFPNEHLPIEISRGCAFNCSFCHFTKRKNGEYLKDTNVLREELIRNYELFGTTGYMFSDDTYNDSLEKVLRLGELFQSLPFEIEWTSYARIDMLMKFPEMIDILSESGLKSVLFGIESLNPQIAKSVGKGYRAEEIPQFLGMLKERWKKKVLISGAFIVGLPGESVESIWNTLNWILEDGCPLDAFSVTPLHIKSFEPDLSDVLVYSKISKNPDTYSMRVDTQDQWKSQNMNRAMADQIVEEFHKLPKYRKRNKVVSMMAFYSRMRNLGYSFEECYEINLENDFFVNSEGRRLNLKKEYLEKILK